MKKIILIASVFLIVGMGCNTNVPEEKTDDTLEDRVNRVIEQKEEREKSEVEKTVEKIAIPTPVVQTPVASSHITCRDSNCLIEAAKDCSSASGTFISSSGIFDTVKSNETQLQEIKKAIGGKCAFRLEVTENTLEWVEEYRQAQKEQGLSEEEVNNLEKEFFADWPQDLNFKGKEMACIKDSGAELADFLRRYINGDIRPSEKTGCTGSYLD
ncbi:MAG: hypothetical protein HN726_00420 [Candidatus Magasanikbacteria bacterium]|jgi:hypothetical protein|nr:hypothetical protein [Candidatus Magasanikbacteria bacterium]MBT4221114.1 hypothetical protein [Candidatus Magasanikbacteria bacterium]MBT4350316.1 hypothetical protein [Candidatus Magasanikbacteria bacterium]MBT4541742.1 hypothetical protein [Candidatus Magasanikbacteria bacterium]MBT6253281.1 hypothetical protein [Candidatus Magasanikbacteria bacterium]